MKTNNKMFFGTSLLVAVILISAYSYSSAYRGDSSEKRSNYSKERHEAMKTALESNDYSIWKDLMEQNPVRGRMLEVINEDNFAKFVEARRLMKEGKYEESNQIREELGLNFRDKNNNIELREEIDIAFKNNNYNAWREIVKGKRSNILEVINEDNFSKLSEAHKLMKEGDYKEARKIKSELGIEFEKKYRHKYKEGNGSMYYMKENI